MSSSSTSFLKKPTVFVSRPLHFSVLAAKICQKETAVLDPKPPDGLTEDDLRSMPRSHCVWIGVQQRPGECCSCTGGLYFGGLHF